MQTTFTKEFMSKNRGCYSNQQLNGCSFMQLEEITLQSIVNSEIPLRDKYWFVCRRVLSPEENVQLAIGVAEIVLEIYESNYPDNSAPRKAIEAAKNYLKIKSPESAPSAAAAAKEARKAAHAADAYAAYADAAYAAYADAAYAADAAAAAYAAYAAAAAAAAAYAADAAAAAYAADAAAAAAAAYAAAAAAYAAAAKYKIALEQFLKDFIKITPVK